MIIQSPSRTGHLTQHWKPSRLKGQHLFKAKVGAKIKKIKMGVCFQSHNNTVSLESISQKFSTPN